jgi:soluble lytic murein transglycosylase-like protein
MLWMNSLRPRQAVFPAILAAAAVITLLSYRINSGYAASTFPSPDTDIGNPISVSLSLSEKFPQEIQRWKALIEENAALAGVDPNLIGALILQESGGQPQIMSSSGAVGLMQVMPRDGNASQFMCINGPCFKDRPSISELNDPAYNIQYGTRYLSALILKSGNIREALKSYGPAGVDFYYADIVLALLAQYE